MRKWWLITAVVLGGLGGFCGQRTLQGGTLKLTVVDKDSGEPIPFRLHLKNHAGVPQVVPRLPFHKDHVACPGSMELTLRKGNYTFEVERSSLRIRRLLQG